MQRRRSRDLAPLIAALTLIACGGSSPTDGPPQTQTGTVSGTVTADGAPVPGASLELTRAGAPNRSATSAANGTYQFTQVPTGTWTLSITPPAGFTVSGASSSPVSVTANQTATADFQLQEETLPPGTVEVTIQDNLFDPNDVTVPVNGTVRWRNSGAAVHNSTGANGAWASANLSPGATFERTFTQAGTFNYSCTLHPGMNGVVRVQ